MDNPGSPNCTTIAKLIDSALAAFTQDGPFTSAWVKDTAAQHMVMDIGAIWQGTAIYPSGTSSEGPGTNVMEAYPPPVATNGAHVTGSIGGGLWMVSAHTKQPKRPRRSSSTWTRARRSRRTRRSRRACRRTPPIRTGG